MFVDIRACRWPLAVALCLAACLFALSPNFRWSTARQSPYAGDLLQEWIGGHIVRTGDRARLYDLDYAYRLQHDPALVGFAWNDDQYLPIVYPPFYYLLVSPLSLVSVYWAAWIWAALMLAALVASCWILQHELSRCRHNGSAKWLAWMLPASLLFLPVLESLSSSQKGTLCLLLFTATFVLWQRGKNYAAGVAFGLLAFKPQLALVIALAALWKRDWRFVAGGLSTGLVLLALSLAVGVQPCLDFLHFACGSGDYMQTSGYDLWKSHTVWGFGKLLAPHDGRVTMAISLALAGIAAYFTLRLVGRECYGTASTQDSFPPEFAGLIMATLLFSPHLFTYDLTILLLPIAIVVAGSMHATSTAQRERSWKRWLVVLLFISPAISTTLAETIGVQITVPLLLANLGCIAFADDRSRCDSSHLRFSSAFHSSSE
jgi:hypothetical protein